MRTAVFSIISPNYRAYARVLMDSVQRHHPEWDRFVLFVGETPERGKDPFTAVPLDALPLPERRQFCFRYTLLELNTAVKPWMFEHLFGLGYERVVYLDPDVVLFSPLAELDAEPSRSAFLTLTPHLTSIMNGDENPSEQKILQAGAYNLGFLAVSRHPSLAHFLAWWQQKLERDCVVDTARGLFVDQKWMDLAPGLFADVAILRHEGYNVAYWNLAQRKVIAESGGFTVNGQPLRFFHFSGVDSVLRNRVSQFGTLQLSEVGDAGELIEEYRKALHAAGHASFLNAPYAFGRFADGTPLPDAARIAYRESRDLQSAGGSDPFAHPELFRGLRDPRKRSKAAARVAAQAYQLLSSARLLVGLLPRGLRVALREYLLGRRDAGAERLRAKRRR